VGAAGGNTGVGGSGGNGAAGGTGGAVRTGKSDSWSNVVNVVNRNVTRVTRN
jgi:hypothetical protein